MDKILKQHFDRFRETGFIPPELSSLKGVKLFDDMALLKTWRANLKGIQWTDRKGNIFRGAIDDMLIKGKNLIVLDFKTRGYPLKQDTAEHYQDQLDIYNLLLQKNKYKTEDYAYLLFYHPSKVLENGSVLFNTDLIKMKVNTKNAERIFKEAVKVLEGKIPPSSEECEYCRWVRENK